jgi:protein-S-isoprenylcysteine O-methyltransferase Ste14
MSYGMIQSILVAGFGLVYFLAPGPRLFTVEAPLLIAGSLLCAIGILLLISAIVALRHAIQVDPEPKPGAELVQSGVYRRFRHPIYTAMLLLVVGLCLRNGALAVAIAGAVVIAFLAIKVRVEERFLAARYPAYEAYRRRTWGLIPGL